MGDAGQAILMVTKGVAPIQHLHTFEDQEADDGKREDAGEGRGYVEIARIGQNECADLPEDQEGCKDARMGKKWMCSDW